MQGRITGGFHGTAATWLDQSLEEGIAMRVTETWLWSQENMQYVENMEEKSSRPLRNNNERIILKFLKQYRRS